PTTRRLPFGDIDKARVQVEFNRKDTKNDNQTEHDNKTEEEEA
ncbi:ribosome maturation factor RimP, partial [Streptomyces violaceoruber]